MDEILRQLVEMPTVSSDQATNARCISYTEKLLRDAGMHVRTFVCEGYPSLVATTRETKHPKLLLQAHIDVVPAPDIAYSVTKYEGKLYGRGVFDMKFGAACFIAAAQELKDDLGNYDFGIMLTTDEELDGRNGVNYLLAEGYRADICLLPDGAEDWLIEEGAKGAWRVVAEAKGKTAHASRPWEGDSATDLLIAFLSDVRQAVAVRQNDHTDTTLVISQLFGGEASNQVPSAASATFDVRFLDQRARDIVMSDLHSLADRHGITLMTSLAIDPVVTDTTLPAVKLWEQITEEVRGISHPGYTLSLGASDARYFAAYNIPTLITRPHGGNAHSDTEWISEKGVQQFYECIVKYIKQGSKI